MQRDIVMPRKKLKEFLLLYRSHPCLWNPKDVEFGSMNRRQQAWNELAAKLQEVDPNATIDTAKKKFHNLRTVYRRHLKRAIETAQGEADVVNAPNLWYFDLLSFLHEKDMPEGMVTKIKSSYVDEEYDLDDDEQPDDDGENISTRRYTSLPCTNLKELLDLYRESPCLWDVVHVDYGNRAKRWEGWNLLLTKYQEVDPTATMAAVKKKVHNCRTVYRRHLKRAIELANGDEDEVEVPKLWYFDLLSFLHEKDIPEEETSKVYLEEQHEFVDIEEVHPDDNEEDHIDNDEEEYIDTYENAFTSVKQETQGHLDDSEIETEETVFCSDKSETEAQDHLISCSLESPIRVSSSDLSRPFKRRAASLKRRQMMKADQVEMMKERAKMIKMEAHEKQSRDRFDAVGENVAYKLRSLSNRQRIIAEKLINDVLYEAELENLNMNCRLLTTDPLPSYSRSSIDK